MLSFDISFATKFATMHLSIVNCGDFVWPFSVLLFSCIILSRTRPGLMHLSSLPAHVNTAAFAEASHLPLSFVESLSRTHNIHTISLESHIVAHFVGRLSLPSDSQPAALSSLWPLNPPHPSLPFHLDYLSIFHSLQSSLDICAALCLWSYSLFFAEYGRLRQDSHSTSSLSASVWQYHSEVSLWWLSNSPRSHGK